MTPREEKWRMNWWTREATVQSDEKQNSFVIGKSNVKCPPVDEGQMEVSLDFFVTLCRVIPMPHKVDGDQMPSKAINSCDN